MIATDVSNFTPVQNLQVQLVDHIIATKDIESAWQSIKLYESIGRIHNLKNRSDMRSEMQQELAKVLTALQDRARLRRTADKAVVLKKAFWQARWLGMLVAQRWTSCDSSSSR